MATSNFTTYQELPLIVFSDEDYYDLDIDAIKDDIEEFNEKIRNISDTLYYSKRNHQNDFNEAITLSEIKVKLKDGYYEGAQLALDYYPSFKYLNKKHKSIVKKFFYSMKKKFNLTELKVTARASNGETCYKAI